jgi:hypothetical protein
MKTTDLFKNTRSAKRINESMEKMFGTKLDLASFDSPKLEDARNKIRTQLSQVRNQSGFNENVENEAVVQAQWMLDAINSEIAERAEHIVDTTVEGFGSLEDEVAQILKNFDENMNEIGGYGDPDAAKIVELLRQGDWDGATEVVWYAYADQDGGELRDMDNYIEDIEDQFKDLAQGGDEDEGGETDDGYALASAGFGSDEDYESIETERVRDPEDWDEGNTEPANNFAISINGKKWKVFKGRGQYADDAREQAHYQQLKDWCAKKSEATGKKWQVHVTGESATESVQTELSTNTLKSYQDKAGKEIVHTMTSGDHMTTDKSAKKVMNRMKGSEKADNKIYKRENESIEQTGDNMRNLREGEIQQASAIVTAKTMVDRVGRWIEELSGMENDTLLQLGDSIRDEMGAEQAKTFISACAPAIQQALQNLKDTREALSTSVRQLTGEEQPAEMLGGEPGMGDEFGGEAEPDMMNTGGDEMGPPEDELGGDEFGAADAAAGGIETAGREQRESIDRSNSLLRALAG